MCNQLFIVFSRHGKRRWGFTFTEVLIAVFLIAMVMAPTIAAIEAGRLQGRSTTYAVIGENLATAMMELVKRSGYNEIQYGATLPSILGTASSVSPLLELPRQIGSSTGSTATTLPTGCPGGATTSTLNTLLTNWRSGTIDRSSGVVTANTNYLFLSADQIAALSGYSNAAAVPTGINTMDAKFAWGLFVENDAAGNSGGTIGYGIKHLAIIVKWKDIRRNIIQYCVIESYVSEVAPRL